MENTVMMNHLVNGYNDLAFTHNYIFGFTYKHVVYMVHATSEVMPYVCTLDKASRGAGYSLRFKPTTAQKLLLLAKGAEVLCSEEYLNGLATGSIYNAGEIFEKLVTEKYGQVWVKDNIPFTEAGDIEVNGIAYQIKYQKATFISEKSLARFERI